MLPVVLSFADLSAPSSVVLAAAEQAATAAPGNLWAFLSTVVSTVVAAIAGLYAAKANRKVDNSTGSGAGNGVKIDRLIYKIDTLDENTRRAIFSLTMRMDDHIEQCQGQPSPATPSWDELHGSE